MTRTRSDLTSSMTYQTRSTSPPYGLNPPVTEKFYLFQELILDGGYHWPLNTAADDGGPFLLHKKGLWMYPAIFPNLNSDSSYVGGLGISGPSGTWTNRVVGRVPDATMISRGSTALARSAPTNPAFSASTALGELMADGLPMVTGMSLLRERVLEARRHSRRSRAQKAQFYKKETGGAFLNVQFGWLPLLSDIRSFASAVKNSHQILESYRQGSDTKIRRGYSFPDDENSTRMYEGNFFPYPSWVSQFGTNGKMSEQYTKRTWFSGAFRYHIPSSPTMLGKFQQWRSMADHLLGVNVTPETVWNIAPWSWAVDWFTNVGDVMTNISNLGKDGLVMQYGYVMDSQRVQRHMSCQFTRQGLTRSAARLETEEWKMRMPASAYGFGVTPESLSAKQVAVIAALGLSRT